MASKDELRVSRRVFEAVKLSPERAYEIARRAGLTGPTVSRLIHNADPIRPDDPRVLKLAEAVGVPPRQAFTRVKSKGPAATVA
jgi:hypothetical protein